MAKAKTFDRRRKSIRNIRKITRTMELISTARFKRAMDRAIAASAYTKRISKLVANLAHSGLEVSHPLLQPRPEVKNVILLVLTANRGLCAGYNASVLRLANARLKELKQEAPQVRLEVSGKRGVSYFRFRGIAPDQRFTHFEDKPAYHEVDVLARRYLEDFQVGILDRLDVAYTKFEGSSRQLAVVETLLPIAQLEGVTEEEARLAKTEYEFLPSAENILAEVVPASFKAK